MRSDKCQELPRLNTVARLGRLSFIAFRILRSVVIAVAFMPMNGN
jgi:hypothetical protein